MRKDVAIGVDKSRQLKHRRQDAGPRNAAKRYAHTSLWVDFDIDVD